jgi:hypothetical protein
MNAEIAIDSPDGVRHTAKVFRAPRATLAKAPSAPVTRIEVTGVLARRPWKRHFSWAREPAEAVWSMALRRDARFVPVESGRRALVLIG